MSHFRNKKKLHHRCLARSNSLECSFYNSTYFRRKIRKKLENFDLCNPFHATGLLLYSLKTSKNPTFPNDFRQYKDRSVVSNGLSKFRKFGKTRSTKQGSYFGNFYIKGTFHIPMTMM